jgi:hypothetical protein
MKRTVKAWAAGFCPFPDSPKVFLIDGTAADTRRGAVLWRTIQTRQTWDERRSVGEFIVPITITYDDGKKPKRKRAKP